MFTFVVITIGIKATHHHRPWYMCSPLLAFYAVPLPVVLAAIGFYAFERLTDG